MVIIMKENCKISIIIPVYNVENFIAQCIESALNQTYKELEIIIVDDGSKDASGIICDKYSKKDDRIIVIHKKNGGVSSARNKGLENATGKYVMFLDSDDFLQETACELLYNVIEANNMDYIIGNYIFTTYDGKKWHNPVFNMNESFDVNIKDYPKSFFVMNSIANNKIFRRDFIEKNNLRFLEGAIAEDAIFCSLCYTKSPNSFYVNDIIFNYRQNKENTSISTSCDENYFRKLNQSYKLIYHNYKSTNNLGFYRFSYARIMPYFLCKIIDTNELKDDTKIMEILNMFSWYFKQKDKYNVVIMNKDLNDIINCINCNNYEKAIINIKEVKNKRNKLNNIEKQEMINASEELLAKMLE